MSPGSRGQDLSAGESRKTPLDRDVIVTAAIALIDVDGLNQLTMRRLGAALGVEAMALYRHFPARSDLIDALVDATVMQTATDPELQFVKGDDWRDYLHRLAHGTRRMALTHPRVFPLIATHPTEAPWIKPPLRSVKWVDAFLTGLQEHHFPPPAAVTVYKNFSTFLLGHLLLEVAGLGLDHEPLATSPPPPPDPIKQEAEAQRVRDAHAAEAVMTNGPDAEEIVDGSTGRSETVADEPSVQMIEMAIGSGQAAPDDAVITTDITAPVTDAVVSTANLALEPYPAVQALAGLLAHETAPQDFEDMLTTLLDRFATLRRP